jgi:hypothetical protein
MKSWVVGIQQSNTCAVQLNSSRVVTVGAGGGVVTVVDNPHTGEDLLHYYCHHYYRAVVPRKAVAYSVACDT